MSELGLSRSHYFSLYNVKLTVSVKAFLLCQRPKKTAVSVEHKIALYICLFRLFSAKRLTPVPYNQSFNFISKR